MTTLFSCVGFSDPFRNGYDGPLLNIVRSKKPDKIILVFSEGTIGNQEKISAAINGIEDSYKPSIIVDPEETPDKDTPYFDKMFKILYDKIMKYFLEEENITLNLSSGTPAMESALFSINRILGLNVSAYQVKTPVNDSNENIEFNLSDGNDGESPESTVQNTSDRILSDKGEKFEQTLIKENVKQFIQEYDYLSAYELIKNDPVLSTKEELSNKLEQFVVALKYQRVFPAVKVKKYDKEKTILLNSFLIFLLQVKRGMTSEVIIRGRNLTEFICEMYLNKNYQGLIKYDEHQLPQLNECEFTEIREQLYNNRLSTFSFLSFPVYQGIFKALGESEIGKALDQLSIFNIRNQIAHNFNELSEKKVNLLLKYYSTDNSYEIVNRLLSLIKFVFNLSKEWLIFFETENKNIISLLEK